MVNRRVPFRSVRFVGATPIYPDGLTLVAITVPVAVPSLFQSLMPFTPSSAVKYRVSPTPVRCEGYDPPKGLISLTRVVPAVVPSLLQSSTPCSPSLTAKNRLSLTRIRAGGGSGETIHQPSPRDGEGVAIKSLMTTVPLVVPSLLQRWVANPSTVKK